MPCSPLRFGIWRTGLLVALLLLASGGLTSQAQDAESDEPAPEMPANEAPAVAPLLQNLFRMFAPPRLAPPGTPPQEAEATRDSVDARIPKDPKVEAIWDASQTAVSRQDWTQAADLLQKLLDLPEDAAVVGNSGRMESARGAANRVLGNFPPTALTEYERRYGGLAQQLLDAARDSQSPERLVDVATRYFHTAAGAEAAARLSTRHTDQLEFVAATRWNLELLRSGWQGARDPKWRLQAALAARHAGISDLSPFVGNLTAPNAQPLTIAGRTQSFQEWLEAVSFPAATAPRPTDWRQFGGVPSRHATSSPGEPLLLEDWAQPLTSVPAIQERLRTLVQDLADDAAPVIPAATPIVIGDKVAFRDLRSVRVVDLKTGRTLWQTEEGISPEQILSGTPAVGADQQNAWRLRINARQFDEEYFGDSAEMHPLSSWLFRDATNGFLSSDGRRLYVLEDVAVMTRNQSGYTGDAESEATDAYGATWSSNRLSAYDLETGRLEWTVGGPAGVESTTLPLAGSFFFGVPTPDRGELFVVATTGQEIRLYALEPTTGRPLWSQLLAYSDTKIELDIARRWPSAPVAIRDGLIVCPTTVGWLVAVDRSRRCLAWLHRYWPRSDEPEFDPASSFAQQRSLHESWAVGAPVICGQTVLFAPPDAETLTALNLLDGAVRWEHPREDGLYIAGGSESRVYIVAHSGIKACDLATGKRLWSADWDEQVSPTGRAVQIGSDLALPLSSRELWLIDARTGEVREKQRLPAGAPPLGNLVKIGHRFLSLGPEGCRSFQERQNFLDSLAALRAERPSDLRVRLQAAEYDLLQRNFHAAVELLSTPHADNWPADLAERRRQALWNALKGVVASAPAEAESSLRQLAELARTPDELLYLDAARVDHLLAAGRSQDAFEHLWTQARVSSLPQLVPRPDSPDVSVARSAWLAGRLQDLWQQADEPLKTAINARVSSAMDGGPAPTLDEQLAAVRRLEFHPASVRLHWALAEQFAAMSQFAQAETELTPWTRHADPAIAVESRLRLARLWRDSGLTADAAQLVERVLRTDATRMLPSGLTANDAVKKWNLAESGRAPVSATTAVQSHAPLEPVRLPAAYAPQVQELMTPDEAPLFAGLSLQLEPQDQRLSFQSRQTGAWIWQAPLRGVAQAQDNLNAPYGFLGRRVVVLHKNVLQVLSPVDRSVLWTRAIGTDQGPTWDTPRPVPQPLLDTESFDSDSVFWNFHIPFRGRLAILNDRAIGIVGRRTLEVYDPRDGRLRWRHRNLAPFSTVFGTGEIAVVIDSTHDQVHALRLLDGAPVESANLPKTIRQTLAVVDNDLITLEATPGLRLFQLAAGQVVIRRRHPLTDAERWRLEFRRGSQLGRVGERELLVIGPRGRGSRTERTVELVDLQSGERRKLDPLPEIPNIESYTPLVDRQRVYLVVNHGSYGSYNYGDSLVSTRVHGTVFAWDRQTGRQLWKRSIEDQNLVLDRFEDSPLLLCLARNWQQVGQASYTTLKLLAIDKATGETLHESTTPSMFSGFHGVRIVEPEHQVELTAYNMRLRLKPTPQSEP